MGSVVSSLDAANEADCCGLCDLNAECVAWSLDGGTYCEHLGQVTKVKYDPDSVSGVKGGCSRRIKKND